MTAWRREEAAKGPRLGGRVAALAAWQRVQAVRTARTVHGTQPSPGWGKPAGPREDVAKDTALKPTAQMGQRGDRGLQAPRAPGPESSVQGGHPSGARERCDTGHLGCHCPTSARGQCGHLS